jgi:hypothetical protein
MALYSLGIKDDRCVAEYSRCALKMTAHKKLLQKADLPERS